MTKLINIKSGAKYDTYIGRAGKGQDGYYGNPHPLGYCKLCNKIHNREESVAEYKKYFDKKIKEDKAFEIGIKILKDRILGCFCVDENGDGLCHGKVIIEYLDNQTNNENL